MIITTINYMVGNKTSKETGSIADVVIFDSPNGANALDCVGRHLRIIPVQFSDLSENLLSVVFTEVVEQELLQILVERRDDLLVIVRGLGRVDDIIGILYHHIVAAVHRKGRLFPHHLFLCKTIGDIKTNF